MGSVKRRFLASFLWVFFVVPLPSVNKASASGVEPLPEVVRVEMSRWYRRDQKKCESHTWMGVKDGIVSIKSDTAMALFWQIPTVNGPVKLDRKDHPWLDDCERPPMSLNKEIQKLSSGKLLEVLDFRYLKWRWKVDYSTIGEHVLKSDGKLETRYEDFPSQIGISILKKGSNKIREVAYVWCKDLPDETMFKTETTIIPVIWKLMWRRFVVESGEENFGTWVSETRDLYADYKAGYPGEEPGRILRIYLRTDSDNTKARAAASYADIAFLRSPPGCSERNRQATW